MLLKEQIYNLLISGQSVFLIGPSNCGKSRFAKEELLLYLSGRGLRVQYFSDCYGLDQSKTIDDCHAAIVDEVEILQDKEYWESKHGNTGSYYSNEYLVTVNAWFDKLKRIKIPCVYIVTRNEKDTIENFLATIKTADWDKREVVCLAFKE